MKQTMKMPTSGSFFNYLMANNSSIPVVGQYATFMHYTDRSVAIIHHVSGDGKTVILQEVDTRADGENLQMGHQSWIHIPIDRFFKITYKWGAWRSVGQSGKAGEKVRVLFGVAKYYYDWSF